MAKAMSLAAIGLMLIAGQQVKASVNPYNYHSLSVEGRGAIDIITETLRVQMTISNESQDCRGKDIDECDATAVQEKTNQQTQKLVSTMAQQDGVISISSGTVSLQPQSEWDDKLVTDVFTGFVSSIQLTAIINGTDAGDFLDESVRMGVTAINGIDYFISDEVMKESQQQALKLASEDAMSQAQAVLDVLGYEVKQIKSVNVPYVNTPFKDNGPANLDSANDANKSPVSAIRTVGYVVKLLLKYN